MHILSTEQTSSISKSYESKKDFFRLSSICKKYSVVLPKSNQSLTIGSCKKSDVVINDPYVSNEHCVIENIGDQQIWIRDLKSKNGTFLNDLKINRSQIGLGDFLQIGKTTFLSIDYYKEIEGFPNIVGQSQSFLEAVRVAQKISKSRWSVLILGETGTGKEVIARMIHDMSSLEGAFVPINCGSIPSELINSELFGHKRGAFTGAVSDRDGVFVRANHGTLFLDEIGELPLELQPHLLRALETFEIQPVGDTQTHKVNVRIIAATNNSNHSQKQQSGLRLDLYHRLATIVINLPPLRNRKEDIPLLINRFVNELSDLNNVKTIPVHIMRKLKEHPWYGNVRELRQAVCRAIALEGDTLFFHHLFSNNNDAINGSLENTSVTLSRCDRAVRDVIEDALTEHGSYRRAAESLGMAKSTLADRVKRYGIVRSKK